MTELPKALYIHIPFCEHICSYCDFPKVLLSSQDSSAYIKVLKEEILSLRIPFDSLDTIYIGGGTPSALPLPQQNDLLSFLHASFPHVKEFSIEANPESLDEEVAHCFAAYGVNRVSIGVQSLSPALLVSLNRHHDKEMVRKAVEACKREGIDNLNLDFISGIPGMTKEDLKEDIAFSLSLAPKHLSFYSLQIEEGTSYFIHRVQSASDDILREQYDFVVSELSKYGYRRYEVSNFALPGYECQHNLTYWEDRTYYAAGLGASGYIGSIRYNNTRSLSHYLQGKWRLSEEEITPLDHEFEFLMLNLRLTKGFSLSKYSSLFGVDFFERHRKILPYVKDQLVKKGGNIALKPEYLYTMDETLLRLLEDLPEKN